MAPKKTKSSKKRGVKKAAKKKTPEPEALTAPTIASLARMDMPYRVRLAERMLGEDVLSSPSVASVETAVLEFTKQAGSAANVRITLEKDDEALRPGESTGQSRRYPVGRWLEAWVEIYGEGQSAVINVSNALPTSVQITCPAGQSQHAGSKPIFVKGDRR